MSKKTSFESLNTTLYIPQASRTRFPKNHGLKCPWKLKNPNFIISDSCATNRFTKITLGLPTGWLVFRFKPQYRLLQPVHAASDPSQVHDQPIGEIHLSVQRSPDPLEILLQILHEPIADPLNRFIVSRAQWTDRWEPWTGSSCSWSKLPFYSKISTMNR